MEERALGRLGIRRATGPGGALDGGVFLFTTSKMTTLTSGRGLGRGLGDRGGFGGRGVQDRWDILGYKHLCQGSQSLKILI